MAWNVQNTSDGGAEALLTQYWRTAPVVLESLGGMTPQISLHDVDSAITTGLLRAPYLEMVRGTTPIPRSAYTSRRTVAGSPVDGVADPAGIRRMLAEGVTLLLRNVEHWHAPTADLTRRLETDLGRRVEAFFFVTPPGAQGLSVHRDDADVLLFQINGSKNWSVYGGPADADWAPGPTDPVDSPLLQHTLQTGEILYIPRGYAHEAVGDRGLSVHLSLTIREVGTRELHAAIHHLLLDGLKLPVRPLDDHALQQTVERLLDQFKSTLPTLEAAEVLARARQAQLPVYAPDPAPLVNFAGASA